jgi:hypothetical protein
VHTEPHQAHSLRLPSTNRRQAARSAPANSSGGWRFGAWCITGFDGVQFLAGLEPYRFAGSDADLGSGAGIAANAGFASADTEYTKSAQFDALTRSQSLLQALEDRVNGCFGLGAWQAGALDYVMNDVLFNQWGNLADATVLTLLRPTLEMLQILTRI